MIEIINLEKSFDHLKVLRGVNLKISDGEVMTIIGKSGCGKSVMVRSVMRIIQEPRRIEGGKVILFCDDGAIDDGLDLLQLGAAVEEDHVLQIAQGFRLGPGLFPGRAAAALTCSFRVFRVHPHPGIQGATRPNALRGGVS